jgi:Cdc6-like AAA superfamily ATPase
MEPSPKRPEDALDENALELAADEAIAEHGGDARAAIRSLLVAKAVLEAARDRALDWVSYGYTRGRPKGG